MKNKISYFLKVLFRLPANVFRYAQLAWQAPYQPTEKWHIFFVFISLWLKAFFLRNRSELCTQQLFGFRVSGYSYTTLSNLFEEIFVSRIYHFQAVSATPLIVDCGANIGFSMLFFKYLYPEASILAFEPDPAAFLLLQHNAKENNLQNVALFNEALADENSVLKFYTDPRKGGLNGSLLPKGNATTGIEVPARKLSEIFIPLIKIDLVKIDVEGAEEQIIKDLFQNRQLQKPKEYLIEYHHYLNHAPEKRKQFLNYFEEIGFQAKALQTSEVYNNHQDTIYRFSAQNK